MAIQAGYADITYANGVNVDIAAWEDLETNQKQYALDISRMYIDDKYVCVDWEEDYPDGIYPDELLTANSKFALEYVNGNLFTATNDDNAGSLISKTVKAGSVSSSKEYSDIGVSQKGKDRFPEISMLLSPYCSRGRSGKLIRV